MTNDELYEFFQKLGDAVQERTPEARLSMTPAITPFERLVRVDITVGLDKQSFMINPVDKSWIVVYDV